MENRYNEEDLKDIFKFIESNKCIFDEAFRILKKRRKWKYEWKWDEEYTKNKTHYRNCIGFYGRDSDTCEFFLVTRDFWCDEEINYRLSAHDFFYFDEWKKKQRRATLIFKAKVMNRRKLEKLKLRAIRFKEYLKLKKMFGDS